MTPEEKQQYWNELNTDQKKSELMRNFLHAFLVMNGLIEVDNSFNNRLKAIVTECQKFWELERKDVEIEIYIILPVYYFYASNYPQIKARLEEITELAMDDYDLLLGNPMTPYLFLIMGDYGPIPKKNTYYIHAVYYAREQGYWKFVILYVYWKYINNTFYRDYNEFILNMTPDSLLLEFNSDGEFYDFIIGNTPLLMPDFNIEQNIWAGFIYFIFSVDALEPNLIKLPLLLKIAVILRTTNRFPTEKNVQHLIDVFNQGMFKHFTIFDHADTWPVRAKTIKLFINCIKLYPQILHFYDQLEELFYKLFASFPQNEANILCLRDYLDLFLDVYEQKFEMNVVRSKLLSFYKKLIDMTIKIRDCPSVTMADRIYYFYTETMRDLHENEKGDFRENYLHFVILYNELYSEAFERCRQRLNDLLSD